SLPLARGVAYATVYPEHLLNVPAGKMGGFPDQVEDFLDYLVDVQAYPGMEREALAASFVPRHHFADYLRRRLQQAVETSTAQLDIRAERVQAMDRDGAHFRLTLASGQQLQARSVVLATGNSLRPLPARGGGSLPA